ncbi:MAG: phosphoribosylanthranilate isomerase [Rickettsiales bacterium]|nr:phosphoribosylanthranilate isomerase [Rickettsiales bacterium]
MTSGATFLGFISFEKSPRHVEPADIASLTKNLPTNIKTVMVMVNPSDDDIQAHIDAWTPSYLQLHGNETVERVLEIKERFNLPIIKAFGIHNADDLPPIKAYEEVADYLLLDAKDDTQKGGTGKAFDWNLLNEFNPQSPWFLSGGLNEANIEAALSQTGAKFIDVSSGIESERGIKDVAKIIAFNNKVKHISA